MTPDHFAAMGMDFAHLEPDIKKYIRRHDRTIEIDFLVLVQNIGVVAIEVRVKFICLNFYEGIDYFIILLSATR